MPPTVRSLDELVKYVAPNYDAQRQQYQQQINTANSALPDQEAALDTAKNNAFQDISQLASNRGMLFSGFAPSQQAKYIGEKYLPAKANLRAKVQDNIARLQSAILGLDTDQRKEAMQLHEGDLTQLYGYNQEQDRRKFEKEQADLAYQREMEKLKTQAALDRSNKAASEPVRYNWTRNAKGGYDVVGANGQRANIDLATAVASQGGGINNLVSLLLNGDSQDKRAAQQYLKDVQKDPTKAYANLLRNRGTAFYTGGGF